MKPVLGILIVLFGIFLGAYLGIWVLFVGGIVQIIEAIKASPVSSMGIAIGIVKIMGASITGIASFFIVAAIGFGVAGIKSKVRVKYKSKI